MRGIFRFFPGTPQELVVPNSIVDEGEETFLKQICRADTTDVPAGPTGKYYVGLCGNTFDETTTLATLAGEPSSTGGYARIAVERDATGWPTLSQVNGVWRAQSKTVTFAASGADFDTAIWRAFLCNVASGTAGRLFGVSGPLPAALTVLDGNSLPLTYELYLN